MLGEVTRSDSENIVLDGHLALTCGDVEMQNEQIFCNCVLLVSVCAFMLCSMGVNYSKKSVLKSVVCNQAMFSSRFI
jgi:hypothetical protein